MKLRTLCLLSLWAVAAPFVVAQIPATDDSYTTSSSPTSNYGTQSSLDVIGPGGVIVGTRQFPRVARHLVNRRALYHG